MKGGNRTTPRLGLVIYRAGFSYVGARQVMMGFYMIVFRWMSRRASFAPSAGGSPRNSPCDGPFVSGLTSKTPRGADSAIRALEDLGEDPGIESREAADRFAMREATEVADFGDHRGGGDRATPGKLVRIGVHLLERIALDQLAMVRSAWAICRSVSASSSTHARASSTCRAGSFSPWALR